jgi:hypothetical protein
LYIVVGCSLFEPALREECPLPAIRESQKWFIRAITPLTTGGAP